MTADSVRERLAAYGAGTLVTAGLAGQKASIEIVIYTLDDGAGRLELRRLVTDEVVAVPLTTALTEAVQRILSATSAGTPCTCS